jgi:hypothetical protein
MCRLRSAHNWHRLREPGWNSSVIAKTNRCVSLDAGTNYSDALAETIARATRMVVIVGRNLYVRLGPGRLASARTLLIAA